MKIKTALAAAAIATASTTSFAGDISDAGTADNDVFVPVQTTATSPSAKYIIPIVACLVICTALGGSGGT
ncbi:MAG: hypothetical protein KIH44_004355 [Octadecabacter sp.]|nr:hypothetical protein [Octadecabacter sp.]